ncbi:MAG: alpha/beta hydrolase [Alphaproteobacteria bacterium]
MHEERISFTNSRGDKLSGVLHHPTNAAPRGAVILCHGMESNKNSEKIVSLGAALAGRGILALRFDFSYAGESSGKFEDITYSGEVDDLRAAYALVRNRHPGKIAILGSSMGGTVALLFAAEEPAVAALVTVAAPVHPEEFPRRALTPKQIDEWRNRGFTFHHGQRLNVSLLHDLEKINILEAAARIICPVLIVHGDADEVVPVKEAHELHGRLTDSKKLLILKGGDHRLSDPAIMQRAIAESLDWLAKPVQ